MAEAFALQPELEKRAYERAEPLFIKNLENVQGDERDVILFSVGYGPDRNGQVSLNFGPVNREGGWRRLNVAVSRARTEMKVFSTLRAEQIDLNRTASEGVAGLKAFLAYAAGGRVALPVPAGSQAIPSAGFEQAIAEALRQAGYTVQTNIGTSSYKMDIGVVDPANPDRYLLGIRCDGQHYLRAGTSRDREIVQPDVLAGLGWQLYQVWAVDWWENPDRTLQEIVEAIESARPKTIPVQAPAPVLVKPIEPATTPPGETLADFAMHRLAEALVNQAAQPYEIARLKAQPASSADTFLLAANKATIVGQLKTVIAAEAPISRNLLARRVLLAWNITRSGTRLNAYLDSLLAFVPVRQVTHGEQVFIWKEGEQPSRYPVFRVAHSEQQRRDPADLPPEELANAVKHVLRHQVSLPRESLVKETARAMGYTRPGTALEAVIEQAIDAVVRQGFAGVKDDRVVYTG
jgi:very-short-patch-repair endonuclease